MQVLITEDEILLAKRLQKLLNAVAPDAAVAGIAHSIKDTVEWLQTHARPDLILMDIELADGQSFDIFQLIQITTPVIFTTAYNEYAIKAFKVNSIELFPAAICFIPFSNASISIAGLFNVLNF